MVQVLTIWLAALAGAAAGPAPAQAQAVAAEVSEQARGLWIGPVRACGLDAGAIARIEEPLPGFTLVLGEGAREVLHRATEAGLGEPMPIRLDGRLLAEPVVKEAITGAAFQVSAQGVPFDAVKAAATAPC